MNRIESGRARLNVFFGILNSTVSALQTFWFIPYVKHYLGTAAYGYISVVNGFVNTLMVISLAIGAMSTRFILVSFEKGDINGSKKYFNSEIVALMVAGLVILCIGISIVFGLNHVMNIDAKMYHDVQMLFIMTLISFLFQMIASPFSSSFFYSNTVYLTYIIFILDYIFRIVVTVYLYTHGHLIIWGAALSTDVIYALGLLFYVQYSYKKMPSLKINFSYFDIKYLFKLIGSGIWISISWAGNLLLSSLNSYFANILCGVIVTGIYSSIMQFNIIENTILNVIVNSLISKMFKYYAQNDEKSLFNYSVQLMILSSLIIGVISGGIIVFGNNFMGFWMGKKFVGYGILILITVVHLPFTLPSQVINQTCTTANKVKVPAVMTICFGVGNVALMLVMTNIFNFGIYGIAVSSLIIQVLRDVIFYPYYLSKIINYFDYKILLPFFFGAINLIATVFICSMVKTVIVPNTILLFLVDIIIGGGISILIATLIEYIQEKKIGSLILR